MHRVVIYIVITTIVILIGINLLHHPQPENYALYQLKQKYAISTTSSVDHSQFDALQKNFKSPQDVTEACLSCHNKRHEEIINSSHWNWDRTSYEEGKGITKVGKKNALNNFCIGANTNEQACAKCHIGFGMGNDKFDFHNARNVDCMVCHDGSEEYIKGAAMAGYPDRNVNLTKVAQNVNKPSKLNCGACHFFSGGGNNVKHGDLEEALLSCGRSTDVHMAKNGVDMSCVDCHTADKHQIKGKLYSVSSSDVGRLYCTECHSSKPHLDDLLNRHYSKIACQTCHIPTYAKENATKMEWEWSTAGKLKDGKPYHEEDSLGNHTYLSIKGSFKWAKNVQPDYLWFNGHASHYILGDKIETIPIDINKLHGSADDPHSKIYPVKIHKGNQIYDPQTKLLIQPKLYAKAKGDSAFWVDFDWNLAAAAGMKKVGLPYSGKYDFADTRMYWPINHMVAPKDETLQCVDCHSQSQSRLANIKGIYIPGKDHNSLVDTLGKLLIWAALLGVIIHGLARIIIAFRKNYIESEEINTNI